MVIGRQQAGRAVRPERRGGAVAAERAAMGGRLVTCVFAC
jgi:hypothetical protein